MRKDFAIAIPDEYNPSVLCNQPRVCFVAFRSLQAVHLQYLFQQHMTCCMMSSC